MKITVEKIQKLDSIYTEISQLSKKVSDLLILAKKNKDKELTITREGKLIQITEGRLWDEVRVLGEDSEAGTILKPLYPDVFEHSSIQRKKADELRVFCHAELGVDPSALRLIDILHLVNAMIDYKLNK